MPNLGLHIGFALESGKRLGHPIVREHQGSFLLGCTTPDVRLFKGWERERTHFFKLATDPTGAGFERMLSENPQLRRSDRLSRETTAFMLGYLCHLNIDEGWICQIWRRHFGKGSTLAGDPLVLVLDRVMQFHLDRRERESIADLEGALESIKGAWQGVEVGLIDEGVLREWQGIVIDRAGRELPWHKFAGMVKRLRPSASVGETEQVMDKIPEMLEKVRAHIPDDEIASFRQAAMDNFVETANRYLKAGQVN